MRKVYVYLFSMIVMLSVIGYTGRKKTELEPEAEPEVSAAGEANITAEFEDNTTLIGSVAKADEYVDFEILIPDLLRQEYAQGEVRLVDTNIVETYFYGTDNQIVYRTGIGLGNISGDYSFYTVEETVEVNEIEVTVKGNGRKWSLAYFSKDDLKYSLSFKEAVSNRVITDIVESLGEKNPDGNIE